VSFARPSSTRGPWRLEALRAAWGSACLIAPSRVIAALGAPSDRRTQAVTRVLGVRHLLQALISVLAPSKRVLEIGGIVDASHSATMALLGAVDPGRRRLAWTDGVIAAGWCAASMHDGRRIKPADGALLTKTG
jgi:hypothetical protein